ncbi:hypothetical protein NA57DRAFT_30866 [Rhizodiscina lignyota]|uniref:DUF7730 domain-containing protein n=1 Tax=Rhizodiscina lignyota TaxID=1504668 RepID=A0A9P4IPL8_9PEZI|nr:hypothetical protein NA57DRAFT_30866 [Rhizodiscina lignyota]
MRASSTPQPTRHDHFPFLQLSAEIRLIIYRQALVSDGPLLFSVSKPEEAPKDFDEDFDSGEFDSGVLLRDSKQSQQKGADLVPALLRVNKQIYREASRILYSENVILLDLNTAIYSVNSLQQKTRSLFRHIRINITSHHDILDGFSDLVRVGLRYCKGLRTLTVDLPGGWATLDPGSDGDNTTAGKPRYSRNNVYANAFHILRWLPKSTQVILEGSPSPEIRKVVAHREKAAKELDEVSECSSPHRTAILIHLCVIG